jgi:hypothetical protein
MYLNLSQVTGLGMAYLDLALASLVVRLRAGSTIERYFNFDIWYISDVHIFDGWDELRRVERSMCMYSAAWYASDDFHAILQRIRRASVQGFQGCVPSLA